MVMVTMLLTVIRIWLLMLWCIGISKIYFIRAEVGHNPLVALGHNYAVSPVDSLLDCTMDKVHENSPLEQLEEGESSLFGERSVNR